jgi:hypothetical protein
VPSTSAVATARIGVTIRIAVLPLLVDGWFDRASWPAKGTGGTTMHLHTGKPRHAPVWFPPP